MSGRNATLYFVLGKDEKLSLSYLRACDQIFIAEHKHEIWVKSDTALPELRVLPWKYRYQNFEGNLLFVAGKSTPEAVLPANLEWRSLQEFMPVTIPGYALPGRLNQTVKTSLIRTSHPQKSVAFIIALSELKTWAETASQSRIEPLHYAVSERGEVLVLGEPLPTLLNADTQEFWRSKNCLLPLGFDFEFGLMHQLIPQKYGTSSWLIFDKEGGVVAIPKSDLLAASRSGIRNANLEEV